MHEYRYFFVKFVKPFQYFLAKYICDITRDKLSLAALEADKWIWKGMV